MATTLTFQMSGCVLITPQFVPGIATNPEVVSAVGSKHTQLVDTQDGEVAVYDTLQIFNVKQPPPHSTISITQSGEGFIARLVRVSQAAFAMALEDQRGTAMGINFTSTLVPAKRPPKAFLLSLLNADIVQRSVGSTSPLTAAGAKLIYDKSPWVATFSFEADPNNDNQIVCGINFNLNRPTKTDLKHLVGTEKLRQWSEGIVRGIVGENARG